MNNRASAYKEYSVEQEIKINPEVYDREIKERYEKQIIAQRNFALLQLTFLLLVSFAQLAILEKGIEKIFSLSEFDKILEIPIYRLISLLTSAFLPVASIIDYSGMLQERIYFLGFKKIPLIYLLLVADVYLTFMAIFEITASDNELTRPATAFVVSAVLSSSSLFLTQAMVSSFLKRTKAILDLKRVKIYGVDPQALDEGLEHKKLIKDREEAEQKAERVRQKLEEEMTKHKEEIQSKEDEYNQEREQYNQEREQLEGKLNEHKDYAESMKKLKKELSQVKTPISKLLSQSKQMIDNLSSFDQSVQQLDFPQPPQEVNDKVIEKKVYYYPWKNPDDSNHDLRLQSNLSIVGDVLLQGIQQQQLPRPNVRNYSPRKEASECLILEFDNYGVIVYCRDEELNANGEKWNNEDEFEFKLRLNEQQSQGMRTLEFTSEEIMSNLSEVLEGIKDAISSQMNRGLN